MSRYDELATRSACAVFQILNVSGSLDLCYYNFLCAHPLGALSDFNHVYSNLGYLLLGALFMLQLRRRKMRRKRTPRDEVRMTPTRCTYSNLDYLLLPGCTYLSATNGFVPPLFTTCYLCNVVSSTAI